MNNFKQNITNIFKIIQSLYDIFLVKILFKFKLAIYYNRIIYFCIICRYKKII